MFCDKAGERRKNQALFYAGSILKQSVSVRNSIFLSDGANDGMVTGDFTIFLKKMKAATDKRMKPVKNL